MTFRFCLCLALLLGLTACGDLPEPFLGNPGGPMARRLVQPPAPRLVIPPPATALLTDAASRSFADDIAQALQDRAVAAFAQAPQKSDWRLVATAEAGGATVVPVFTLLDPQGKQRGTTRGPAVAAQAWEAAAPATLTRVAEEAAPRIAGLLNSVELARQEADPNSLFNRPAKVMVAEVTGAPGDGDLSLTNQMRKHLSVLGPRLQDTAKDADFTVQGHVRVVPIAHHKERVEIQWSIKDAKRNDVGRVVQLNEIPAGTLDNYWGDVAVVVATEAAGGVEHVIKEHRMVPPNEPPAQAAVHGQAGGRLVEGRRSGVEPVRE